MLAELHRWTDDPRSETFPFSAVRSEIIQVGKHFLDDDSLTALARARDELPRTSGNDDRRDLIARFLDVVLDKADGRYDYLTYTAMPLFPIAEPSTSAEIQADRTIALLVADLLDFELGAMNDAHRQLPQMRPTRDVIEKRCRLAVRAAHPAAKRAGLLTKISSNPDDDITAARDLSDAVLSRATSSERELLALTMQPVYTIHDEHMFLRVLQAFEATFVFLARQLHATIRALHASDVRAAAELLRGNSEVLHEAGLLFSLLATMQVTAFRTFRAFTEGASAIQSEGYKTVESLCRKPDPERLASLPYNSVPKVRARIHGGQVTVQDAAEALASDLGADDAALLVSGMHDFEDAMIRWRRTHHSVAVRMLGASRGSGYSEGTPYLKSVINLPVFNEINQVNP